MYKPTTQTFAAVNCIHNNYGVNAHTPGLSANPCRDCPTGLLTNATMTPGLFVMDNGVGGFTAPKACVTAPGFGFNGREAVKCQVGTFSPPGSGTW